MLTVTMKVLYIYSEFIYTLVFTDNSWCQQDTEWAYHLHPIDIQPFECLVGPNTLIPDNPLDIFQLFFTDEILEVIVDASNQYAGSTMPAERFSKWAKYTFDDLKAYLGFQIMMLINRLPSFADYWSKNPNMRYGPVADRISRDRFRELQRYLHFVDNSTVIPRGEIGHDRVGKVRPILISHTSAKKCISTQEVTIDEAMIKFQGRSSLK